MCNLYRLNSKNAEIARMFEVREAASSNRSEEVYPGYPGLVVAGGFARTMNWGFPLIMTGKKGQKLKSKPVTNARDDKLHTPFWRQSFEQRRCLIPVTAWAEPEGASGQMTRTWYRLPECDIFAVAGLWRASDEWGDVYTMVMVESSPRMQEVHDRMPVILAPEHWHRWLTGTPREAFDLCRTWQGDLAPNRTDERWAGGPSLMGSLFG
ncbi:MAG: hypothetical protein BGP00_04825 [Novosphingobium sp. 63-713]|uniref:SOS response-associated peptidase n=1 Tax=unclassified Novosphingobium TaxID=2644732 RepID=UPI00096745FB|nr:MULTISPECIES: SOS response-associated peptidase family protein [unclassified Novosphingobium]MBN9142485.1 SOS response-associated peptidase family protein [Novosphingobium sp.]OJX93889.1 MAG: hypothetical protein BGP00_04825 [Novosphingobium sp. 63-713]